MSGHSKWANIKRKKEVNDKAKSNIFGKLSRVITLAVIEGGGPDPDHNVKLRLAVDLAKQANMPKDNIARAIEKGSGPDKEALAQVRFEAFGPSGSALLIEATTDNNNRTYSEVRNVLDRHGGKMAGLGAVSYMFSQSGVVLFTREENREEDIFQFAERVNATDLDEDEEHVSVYIPFEEIGHVPAHLGDLKASSPELVFRPTTTVQLNKEDSDRLITLMGALEDLDDVAGVYTNAEFITE